MVGLDEQLRRTERMVRVDSGNYVARRTLLRFKVRVNDLDEEQKTSVQKLLAQTVAKEDRTGRLRDLAYKALLLNGEAALSTLKSMVNDPDFDLDRLRTVMRLLDDLDCQDQDCQSIIEASLTHPSQSYRLGSLDLLASFWQQGLLHRVDQRQVIEACLDDGSEPIQNKAFHLSLGLKQLRQRTELIAKHLDRFEQVDAATLIVLMQTPELEDRETLIRRYFHANDASISALVEAEEIPTGLKFDLLLKVHDRVGDDILLGLLRQVRKSGELEPRHASQFCDILSHSRARISELRLLLVQCLRDLDDQGGELLRVFEECLDDKFSKVRVEACLALAKYGASAMIVVSSVLDRLNDDCENVREAAESALAKILS